MGKKILFFQNKDNSVWRVALVYFCKPPTFGLIEDILIVLSTSPFNVLQNAILVQEQEENLGSHNYAVEKWRSILIAFPDNCGYYSLIVH